MAHNFSQSTRHEVAKLGSSDAIPQLRLGDVDNVGLRLCTLGFSIQLDPSGKMINALKPAIPSQDVGFLAFASPQSAVALGNFGQLPSLDFIFEPTD